MKVNVICAVALTMTACTPVRADSLADDILTDSQVKGGLVVHVGCGDGQLTVALHADQRYLVHGLDASEEMVQRARQTIRSRGVYGQVSAELLRSSQLPYSDNLVNLMVVEDPSLVAPAEVMRVLAPCGVAYVRSGIENSKSSLDSWQKTVKPWPDEIDQWTHFLYDATGNAVAKDSRVGPPRHLQWLTRIPLCPCMQV